MGAAIGSMLGFAAGVAVSPFPIVAIILLLATPKGRATGSLFAAGWVVGLAALGGVVLALAGPANASSDTGPAKWTGWLKLLLGLLLLAFAVKQWRSRPKAGTEPPAPKWMASLDTLQPAKSFGLGALLATVNPKNGTLTIAAAASIAATGAATGEQIVAIALFVIIGSLGVLAPLAVYLFTGEKAVATLESWRHWFIQNNSAIMAVLFFVIGLKLVGDGITVLS
ncbi:Sap-like sulfolipid-1-addressing protein [Jatrophihabitans sp. GAS493]|uniref:GAP family protein n=1 Tax=Jatrophihabitans sp. GAS493 TaxID=1907575 RepID=UPI000BB945DF|nr:GAP family protein [Jatrophihabitans sp. GAS493]SOD72479.1 Sap-like sulfolipid-1-addressing protein [Jatrophihabitans sp. GAS493]